MAIEMNDDEEQSISHGRTETTTPNTTTLDKPRVVSLTHSADDQPAPGNFRRPSPLKTGGLDKKLRVAHSRLQQEDLNTHALGVSDQVDAKVGNIDQVRDLLFGGHMRDSDKRIKHLEERFNQENMNFREEMFERIKALEERLDCEIDGLADKGKLERQERLSALQNHDHELKLLKNELNNRVAQLDDKFSYELKSLRQQTHKSLEELALQLRQQNDNLTHLVNQEVAHLHDEKVNRNDLAAFFNEFAIHLTRNYEPGDSSE
jgi:hypothetical protein